MCIYIYVHTYIRMQPTCVTAVQLTRMTPHHIM